MGVRLPAGRVIEAGEDIDVVGGTREADADTRGACGGSTSVFLFGYLSHPSAQT